MNRQPVTPQLRDYVIPHDRRIAQLTGQPFGDAYFNGLLRDPSAVFDSVSPIAAMLAAEKIAGRGLDLLSRLQTAHYAEGRRIADREVLIEMAGAIGLDSTEFGRALDETMGEPVCEHIADTRRLMSVIGARGFPTFALEREGRMTIIDVTAYLGRPEALSAWLSAQSSAPAIAPKNSASFACGPDTCSI